MMTQDERLDFLVEKFKEDSGKYKDLQVGNSREEKIEVLRSLMNIRMPKALEEDTLAVQDDYLKERAQEKGVVEISDIQTVKEAYGSNHAFSDRISIWQGDITRLKVDAIVNAANSQMLGCFVPMHTCIDNCIHTFAGVQLRAECNRQMDRLRIQYGRDYEQPTAVPMLTGAYNLPAKKVIHIVGPIVQGRLTKALEQDLSDCYKNTLDLCMENGLKSVAFCCISTGVFHFPNQRAAEIAVETVSTWLKEHPTAMERIIFNVFKDEDKMYYEQLLYLGKKQNTEEQYTETIEKIREKIKDADAVFVGTGAGISTAAGYSYVGEKFEKYFGDFGRKYGFKDMYSGGFYPFPTPEELWAYWSRYIYINRYTKVPGTIYQDLLKLVKEKDYFVLTTNVDHCFQKIGFDKKRLFYTQGDYGLWQCSRPCHEKTYENEEVVRKMVLSQGFEITEEGTLEIPEGVTPKMEVPTELIPKCPVCGEPMSMNLRADSTFVEDEGWHKASERYSEFVRRHQDLKTVFLEIGVGFNTPGIIKYPFWNMTARNEKATYICLNYDDAGCPTEIKKQSICMDGDAQQIVADILKSGQS